MGSLVPPAQSVAIVIASFNAASYVARAVRAALAEPEVSEVIVVDDASRDETIARAKDADDGTGRLLIIAQPRNAGPAAARNRALGVSRADWVGVLDADDFFKPGRIGRLLAAAKEADFIADDMEQVFENAPDAPGRPLLGPLLPAPRRVSFQAFVASNVSSWRRRRGELGFIKPLMRRAFLDEQALRYDETLRLGEDYELYARALAKGARLWLIPGAGYVSVMREDSLSGQHSEDDLLRLRDCDGALAKLEGLSRQDKAALRAHGRSVDCRLQWRLLINAVKARDVRAAWLTFLRPFPVPFFLFVQLGAQAFLRSRAFLKGLDHDKR